MYGKIVQVVKTPEFEGISPLLSLSLDYLPSLCQPGGVPWIEGTYMKRKSKSPVDGWGPGGIYQRAHEKAMSKIYDKRPLRDKNGDPIKNHKGKFTWVPITTLEEEQAEYKINFERYVRRFKYDHRYSGSIAVRVLDVEGIPNIEDSLPCEYESAIMLASNEY